MVGILRACIRPGPNALARRACKECKIIAVIVFSQLFAVLIDEHEHIIIDCNNFLAAESRFKVGIGFNFVINLLIIGVVFGNKFNGVGKRVTFGPHERTGKFACGVGLAGEGLIGSIIVSSAVAYIHLSLLDGNIVA